MSQPDFYTMCATVFAPDGRFYVGTAPPIVVRLSLIHI